MNRGTPSASRTCYVHEEMPTVSVSFIDNGDLDGDAVCRGCEIGVGVEARQTTPREINEGQRGRETPVGAADDEHPKCPG